MSPIIAMVEGRKGGACEEGGGRWGLFLGRGVLVGGVALLGLVRLGGCEARESVVGRGGSAGGIFFFAGGVVVGQSRRRRPRDSLVRRDRTRGGGSRRTCPLGEVLQGMSALLD